VLLISRSIKNLSDCKESENWTIQMKENICNNRTCEECKKWEKEWKEDRE